MEDEARKAVATQEASGVVLGRGERSRGGFVPGAYAAADAALTGDDADAVKLRRAKAGARAGPKVVDPDVVAAAAASTAAAAAAASTAAVKAAAAVAVYDAARASTGTPAVRMTAPAPARARIPVAATAATTAAAGIATSIAGKEAAVAAGRADNGRTSAANAPSESEVPKP